MGEKTNLIFLILILGRNRLSSLSEVASSDELEYLVNLNNKLNENLEKAEENQIQRKDIDSSGNGRLRHTVCDLKF